MIEDRLSRRAALAGATLAAFGGPAAIASAAVGDRAARAYAARVIEAMRANQRIPIPTRLEPGMSEARAYAYQKAIIDRALASDSIAGIKGGAMNTAGRLRLGGGPILGVLFGSGSVEPGAALRLSDYRSLLIETEIGFELGRPVSAPVPDAVTLRRHIAAVRPMFELPDNAFEGDGDYAAIDLIAANVLSRSFIAGARFPPDEVNLDDLRVRLNFNGVQVQQALGRDTYGDQWSALLWLVNNAFRIGGPLKAGCLILTGALGGAVKAKPGVYQADFGALGMLSFSVAT